MEDIDSLPHGHEGLEEEDTHAWGQTRHSPMGAKRDLGVSRACIVGSWWRKKSCESVATVKGVELGPVVGWWG